MSVLYLAIGSPSWSQIVLKAHPSLLCRLSVLASFAFIKDPHLEAAKKAKYAMLDSGAFSAFTRGRPISEEDLIRFSLSHPEFDEVVALDTIGDPEKTLQAAIRMERAGLSPIPVFHIGEDFGYLTLYKERFRKVGLSWGFGEKKSESRKWVERCFSLAWPCLFHSFGRVDFDILTKLPFDSADASTPLVMMAFGHGPKKAKNKFRSLRVADSIILEWLHRERLLESLWSAVLEPLRKEKKPREWRNHDNSNR